jgi:hypothetical protein
MQSIPIKTTKTLFAILAVFPFQAVLSNRLSAQAVTAVSPSNNPASESNAVVAAMPEHGVQPTIAPVQNTAQSELSLSQPSTCDCTAGVNCQCAGQMNYRRTYPAYYPSHRQRKQADYWGYPEYFCEPELGSSVYSAMQSQKAQGVIQQTILYRYDFYPENSPMAFELTPYGKRRLDKLASRALPFGTPLKIERCPNNAQLDETRKQMVAEYAVAANLGWSPDMICLVDGVPGISGTEAILHYKNLMTQTMSGPSGSGSGDQRGNSNASAMIIPNAGNMSPNAR